MTLDSIIKTVSPREAGFLTNVIPVTAASAAIGIALDEVELWQVELDSVPADVLHELRGRLSSDELERAARFHFERDARRFAITRGVLRCVLAEHLEVSPRDLQFGYGPAGKPFLAMETLLDRLHFNVTHAQNLALIAITRSGEIGIDLEHVRDFPDWEQVAATSFPPGQLQSLREVPETRRAEAFFRAWTQEEATVKALGCGLGGDVRGRSGISLYTFTIAPDFVASVALSAAARFVTLRPWGSGPDIAQPMCFERSTLPMRSAASVTVLP